MSKKVTFTPAAIDALKEGVLLDPRTPGLLIEASARGQRVWRYRRRIVGRGEALKRTLGRFPKFSIADARAWAEEINTQIEGGFDPREIEAKAEAQAKFTVDFCHALYMDAVRVNQHRTKRTKHVKPLKPRTIADKLELYERNVRKVLGANPIDGVTEKQVDAIVLGLTRAGATTQANRLGAEMRVFFTWACSRRGEAAGISMKINPAARIGELWNPETIRKRWLDHDELPLFLRALAQEPERHHRRALLLLLLTGVRKSELLEAPSAEVRDGRWIIPGERTKNGEEHPIALAPWTAKLINTNETWIIASPKIESQPMRCGWPKVIERIRLKMEEISDRKVEHFTPHDLRRTMRSHIEDHGIDEALAERMINHKITGLAEIYNRNKRTKAMAAGFLAWDRALAAMAVAAGVGNALEVVHSTTWESD